MSLVLTTDTVPDQEKVAYWNDAVSRALVPVTVAPRDGRRFDGRIASDCLGYLRVSRMEADAGRVSRTPALIERSPEALVAVGLLVSGSATFIQDGRRAEMAGGDLVFYDTARPFSFTYPERFATHVFQLPRHVLGVADGDIRRVTGTAIGTAHGLGAVLRPFLATLADAAPSYPAAVGHRLAGHVVDLFATLITDQALRDPDDGRDHLVLSVRDHIDRKLGDPSLSPESIARAHHISVRYLHRLFEGEGITVSRLIQQRRLEACGRELARRGRVTPTVSAVARRWGFVNPAHFSRAFRAAYGVSPREWRTLHLERGEDEQPAGPTLT
ncbi:transcriptional regulator [Streptomyces corchorusii]|uniref:Transcriptional regulator n=2 Tax=Streptomyces TaxID=1883 RepID=A0A101Q4L6_STRCK|nr:putative transcriptional regulator [Streptomyces hygroscopicus subsp. jinggangensis 5008]AGF61795.1 putative transcriptional regulator [Streptomyces hygroscopicus subsp. jinggangensis TL01]KUN23131.1 transcriptional regulator [Streptomyces corchorusii]